MKAHVFVILAPSCNPLPPIGRTLSQRVSPAHAPSPQMYRGVCTEHRAEVVGTPRRPGPEPPPAAVLSRPAIPSLEQMPSPLTVSVQRPENPRPHPVPPPPPALTPSLHLQQSNAQPLNHTQFAVRATADPCSCGRWCPHPGSARLGAAGHGLQLPGAAGLPGPVSSSSRARVGLCERSSPAARGAECRRLRHPYRHREASSVLGLRLRKVSFLDKQRPFGLGLCRHSGDSARVGAGGALPRAGTSLKQKLDETLRVVHSHP